MLSSFSLLSLSLCYKTTQSWISTTPSSGRHSSDSSSEGPARHIDRGRRRSRSRTRQRRNKFRWADNSRQTGWVSKNLTLYKNACQTKPTSGKCYSLFTHRWQPSLDQNKFKNRNILKWIIYEFLSCFLNVFLLLIFWVSGFCWSILYIPWNRAGTCALAHFCGTKIFLGAQVGSLISYFACASS